MTIFFVSLISRDNRPLYIQPFSPYEKQLEDQSKVEKGAEISFIEERNTNEILKYNFLSHMSLDIFESPFSLAAASQQTQSGAAKLYNLLLVQDGIFVFGHQTNTGLKIVIGTSRKENELQETNEDGLNTVFKGILKAYLALMCNPFKTIGSENEEIDNPTFDKRVKAVVTAWNDSH